MHNDFNLRISLEACSSTYPIYNPPSPRDNPKKYYASPNKPKSKLKPRNRLIHNIIYYCYSCFRE